MNMDVNKIIYVKNNQAEYWCRYFRHWYNIPVFITNGDRDSRSALYKDGTSFIIISDYMITTRNIEFIINRLWHEVAHLYYRDVWKPWDICFEYRADLLASAATDRTVSLNRLYDVKNLASDPNAVKLLDKRIENLYGAPDTYTKEQAFHMLSCLRPVNIIS